MSTWRESQKSIKRVPVPEGPAGTAEIRRDVDLMHIIGIDDDDNPRSPILGLLAPPTQIYEATADYTTADALPGAASRPIAARAVMTVFEVWR